MDATTSRRLGYVLMTIGFLWGSFLTVKHAAMVEWGPYAIALILTAAGAAALRHAASQAGAHTEKVAADISTIERSLRALVDTVRAMNVDKATADPFGFPKRIDDECMDTINAFVEAREAMIHRYGLAHYATMMDSFALGERALNRAWCAAADGYVDELSACLERCQRHWEAALAAVLAVLEEAPSRSDVEEPDGPSRSEDG